jgi:hypothetical protein
MFNVQNSTQLIKDLKDIKIYNNSRLTSFDISDMYANIPICELRSVIVNILNSFMLDDQQCRDIFTNI